MTKRRSSAGWRVSETMTDAASRRPATTERQLSRHGRCRGKEMHLAAARTLPADAKLAHPRRIDSLSVASLRFAKILLKVKRIGAGPLEDPADAAPDDPPSRLADRI